jgi:hypothetical protein
MMNRLVVRRLETLLQVHVEAKELTRHPFQAQYYKVPGNEEWRYKNIRASIQKNNLINPLIVCGRGCAHPRGAVLSGWRRRTILTEQDQWPARAIFIDKLTADEERELILF